jgi:PAS domain S-box-containing protein
MPVIAALAVLLCLVAAPSAATEPTSAPEPADAAALLNNAGPWILYRPQIVGAGLLIVLQSAMIATLLVQRSRRRHIESALIEAQQRYSLASAAGAVGIWDWNFETSELFIDSRLKSLLGFDDAEISTRPQDWGSKVHPQDLAESGAAVQACLDGHSETYQVEHRMLHKNGSVRWMLSRGSAIRGTDGQLRRLVGTKVDITERKEAEASMRQNQAVLRSSNQQIQDLAGLLIASQEVERARIARELHDDLSQQTAGLSIALSALKRRLGAQPETSDLSGDISLLQERALGLAENIRNLSHELHPSVLQHAGLVAALTAHCSDIERQHALNVTFDAAKDVEVPPALALCLYRVTQEALRNIVTHSGAGHAKVRLSRLKGHLELTIEDDGRGFDTATAARGSRGLGLVSINERVRLAGGTVSIVTELKKGTRVRVHIPSASHVMTAPV